MGIESTLPGRRSLKLPGLVFYFVTVVVGAVTFSVAGAARGATGATAGAASASTADAGAAGSQQAGFSGRPASATAGASTFFSQPARTIAATNTIELIANFMISFSPIDHKRFVFGS